MQRNSQRGHLYFQQNGGPHLTATAIVTGQKFHSMTAGDVTGRVASFEYVKKGGREKVSVQSSGGEFKESADESILLTDIPATHSSDLTLA